MKYLLFFSTLLTGQLLTAQTPALEWEFGTGAPSFGSASSADLDNDGFLEIVFTTYTNDGHCHCLNAEDGSVLWSYDIGGCGDVAPLIADVTGDGNLDVVVNGSCNPTLFCIDGPSGSLHWSVPSGGGDSPPTTDDVDDDGINEILFGNFNGQVRIVNGEDGSEYQTIQVNPFGSAVQTEPTLVDLDNDGDLEFLAANFFNDDGNHVWAYETDGSLIWTSTKPGDVDDFHAYHGGAVADIDGDDLPEYVIGSGAGYVHAINLEDGSDLWFLDLEASNMSAITIVDADFDGELEVVFNNNDYVTFDERIWILDGATGDEEWSYPIVFPAFRGIAVSDINDNGQLDFLSGHYMGDILAVEAYNGLLWEYELLDFFSDVPWLDANCQPLIADFDNDGMTEIFVTAGYGTYEPDEFNDGAAYLIESGMSSCPEWLTFRHDNHRTGYLPSEEIEAACGLVSIDDEESHGSSIYPNPVSDLLTVDLQGFIEQATMRLFNPSGALVMEKRITGLSQIDMQDLAAGVYQLQLIDALKTIDNQSIVVFD